MNVHIMFGESSAGAMKWLLSKEKRQEHVIEFPDSFAIGPIHELETEKGSVGRIQWFKDNLAIGDMAEYFRTIMNLVLGKRFRKLVIFLKTCQLQSGQLTMRLNKRV